MKLDFFAEFAVFLNLKFSLAFCVHIDLIPGSNVILILTDGTN